MGNPQFPDGAWEIVHIDAAVVDVADPALRVADRVPGDWSRAGDASFLSTSTFPVTAIDVGRSRVEFHFEVDGETIDLYSVTFDVVDDACAVPSNQSTCDNRVGNPDDPTPSAHCQAPECHAPTAPRPALEPTAKIAMRDHRLFDRDVVRSGAVSLGAAERIRAEPGRCRLCSERVIIDRLSRTTVTGYFVILATPRLRRAVTGDRRTGGST